MVYRVSCTACPYYEEIEDLNAVFDVKEEHEKENEDHHRIEFEWVEED